MIVTATDAPDFVRSLKKLAPCDPFVCRILSLYNTYHPDLAFVDYWMTADENGRCTGAIARNGSSFILFLTDDSDLDEISSFLRVSGASGILCNGKYHLDFTAKETEGVIMKINEPVTVDGEEFGFIVPDIKDVYDLIVKCAEEGFMPPPFDEFYVDVNHRLRHQAIRMYGIEDGGDLAAIAMTVAESDNGAVLGAVACAPEYRRMGYASKAVSHTVNCLVSENKTVFLHRSQNANAAFYNKLGFTECGVWREYNT